MNSNVIKRNDVAVIIRQCGERTLELCKRLVEEQVDPGNVVVIQEIPFSKAVQRTFEIGLDFNLPWTMAIDADVLIMKETVCKFLEKAEKETYNAFSFNVRSYDKFFASPRYGGPHLYRTSMLSKAIGHFPDEETTRPETIIGEILQEKEGFENILYKDLMSLHDYEQWYRDIYRKAYVHAQKHGNNYVASFLRYWSRLMHQDTDYKVALVGLCHGIAAKNKPIIDIRTLPQNYRENELLAEIDEKLPLILDEFSPRDDVYGFVDSINYSNQHPRLNELQDLIKNAIPCRIVPGLLAYPVNKISGRIYNWAKFPKKKKH